MASRTRASALSGGDTASPAQLLSVLAEAYEGPAWHGPSLRSALRGVKAREARWSPGPGRPSIWALTLHAAHGKFLVIGRLAGVRNRRFPRPLARQWWPRLPVELDEARWRADRALLEEMHGALLSTVGSLSAARLGSRRPGKRHTLAQETIGIALHDVYHAGQIQLARRLREGGH